jgi:Cu(I)/Ag(I) efflux system protein CusF
MKYPLFKVIGALGFAVLAMNAYADQGGSHKGMDMGGMKMDCSKHMENMKAMEGMKMDCMGSDAAMPISMSDGEVKAVDKANKNITLKHGPIKSKTVEMGPMTMSFPVQNASLLANVKVGDKVKFTVENVKDEATVTALKVQK